MIKTYNEFTKNNTVKIKDIITVPNELKYIYDICLNEIQLVDEKILAESLYKRIMILCMKQYYNLTYNNINFINIVNNEVKKSNNQIEAKKQFKKLLDPKNEFSAYLLKMINEEKPVLFVDDKFKKYRFDDIYGNFIFGNSLYSVSFKRTLLNSVVTFN